MNQKYDYGMKPMATEKQLNYLQKLGIKTIQNMTVYEASTVISSAKERRIEARIKEQARMKEQKKISAELRQIGRASCRERV